MPRDTHAPESEGLQGVPPAERYALQPYEEIMANLVDSREITGGAELVGKEALVGKEFIVVDWRWNASDFEGQGEFVSVVCQTPANELLVFNDGGVGIAPVLRKFEELHGHPSNSHKFMYVKRGLRRSVYEGPRGPATTFYFS